MIKHSHTVALDSKCEILVNLYLAQLQGKAKVNTITDYNAAVKLFDKMNYQIFEFEEDAGEVVSDIHFCELLKVYADCATLIFADNTIHHVDMHLAICIYNGEFDEIILDM